VVDLRQRISLATRSQRYGGLRDQIEELLLLVPNDGPLRQLLDVVPWEPGPEMTNSVGMKLILVPAGRFVMGSPANESGRVPCEGPLHEVEITRSFYLAACLVTQEQYQRVLGVNPAHFHDVPSCNERLLPVERVSWEEAVDFCQKLSELPEERQRGRRYRLPTEAEWEYVCRAGQSGLTFSEGRSLGSQQANFDGRYPYGALPKGEFLRRTSVAGCYPANAWGFHDLHGNLWEWCADWFAENWYRRSPVRDPTGSERGEARVLRGGSWQNHARLCRSACRDSVGPCYHSFTVGFRVAMTIPEK
jgi:formylglycine-generating enzyme required for sulfatase activity